jgi:AcrR family transcriptional regulator
MAPRTSEPRSRRDRPAKPALTYAGIIGTAVRLMRAEGLERVTMRRLAQELDTGPASLYVYVKNTAALHAAVLETLLGDVDLGPVTARGDWRDRLAAVLASYTEVLFAYPGLARSALTARPDGDNYLRLLDGLLSLLYEGGVPDGQAAWGVDVLLQVATATAAEHAPHDGVADTGWSATADALRAAPATAYPRLHAVADSLLSGTAEQRLAWSFRMLATGIAGTPTPGDRYGGTT